jgi:hypothetical protein
LLASGFSELQLGQRIPQLLTADSTFTYHDLCRGVTLPFVHRLPGILLVFVPQGCSKYVSSVLLTDDGNEGNNQATVRCQLAEGHTGKHWRSFTKLGKYGEVGI